MINNGDCKSKILLSLQEKGKSCSKTWVHVAASMGQLYSLDESDLGRYKQGEVELVKIKTDKNGKASLGLNLPDMVGLVHLAAGKKKSDVAAAAARAADGEIKTSSELSLAQIQLEAGKPAKIILETEEKSMIADGVSTLMVSALVMDEYGNPIKGEEVSFESDLGIIDTEGVSSITDETGRAFTAISSQGVGTATVKAVNRYRSWIEDVLPGFDKKEKGFFPFKEKGILAASGRSGDALTAEIRIEFIPSSASNLILSVDKPVVAADGKSETRICALLKDGFGNPVKGRKMVFETDLGEILPSAEVATDNDGKAIVSLRSERVGAASVRARTVGEEGLLSATQVVFEAASPAKITVTVDRDKTLADGESEFSVSVEVLDEMGNPVPGKPVLFETDLGALLPDGTRTTDKDGKADVRVSSRAAGKARLIATCGEANTVVELEFEPGKPSSIAISLNPTVEETWRNRISQEHWARLQEALKHLGERRFAKAIKILEEEESESLDTSNYPALCDLAFAYQQSGRKDDAERIYRSIIKHNGSRKEIQVRAEGVEEAFGVVLPRVNGEKSQGKDFMDLEPRDYLVNIVVTDDQGNHIPDLPVEFEANFGWIPDEYKQGHTNVVGAATSLVTTFAPPGSSEQEFAWVNLGHMKENALDYAGAEECYRSAIKVMPGSKTGLDSLASVLVKTGDIDGAKKCFYNLARAQLQKGQLTKALDYYGKAIELDPKYARALAGYGAACLRMGELDRARRYLEEGVKLDRSLKAALANLGLLYYLTGKFDKAITMNRRTLKLDAAFRPALLNLHQIHMAKGEREKAEGYAERIRNLGG